MSTSKSCTAREIRLQKQCLRNPINVEKVLNVMKKEMFDQGIIKTLKTIKCLTRVLSKHSKQSTLKTKVKDSAQSSRSKTFS